MLDPSRFQVSHVSDDVPAEKPDKVVVIAAPVVGSKKDRKDLPGKKRRKIVLKNRKQLSPARNEVSLHDAAFGRPDIDFNFDRKFLIFRHRKTELCGQTRHPDK